MLAVCRVEALLRVRAVLHLCLYLAGVLATEMQFVSAGVEGKCTVDKDNELCYLPKFTENILRNSVGTPLRLHSSKEVNRREKTKDFASVSADKHVDERFSEFVIPTIYICVLPKNREEKSRGSQS